MEKCKALVKAETEARRWRRIARRRRLDAEAQAEELVRVQKRCARVKTLREEEREISEAYSNSAEKEINKLSDALEQAAKTVKELKDRNLTLPSEHSFAEHEAYLVACAKVEELANKLHDCEHNWACEQNELRCCVAEALDYKKGSYDGCEIIEEVKELKHNYDNAMEVLAATTRQRDQLHGEVSALKTVHANLEGESRDLHDLREEVRELKFMVARVVGYDTDDGFDVEDFNVLQEVIDLKRESMARGSELDEMKRVLAPKVYQQ